jgi:hypothetical protein
MRYINIRGTNGSGKTTLLRGLVASAQVEKLRVPIPGGRKNDVITIAGDNCAVVGDYSSRTTGGYSAGLDRIQTQAEAKSAIEFAATLPGVDVVLFEGLLVSTIYGPWLEWSRANGGMCWAYLDTPINLCLDRVQRRNGGKPVKTEQIVAKHRTIDRTKQKAEADGQEVAVLRHELALDDLERLIL